MHPTRIFKKPEELLKAFEGYKESTKEAARKWGKVQYVGKDGNRVEDYPMMPLTFEGFSIYCRKNYGCVKQYFDNQQNNYDDFLTICSHVKEEIRDNQITGGLLGFFNPSITQRLNGLAEKSQVDFKTEQPLF